MKLKLKIILLDSWQANYLQILLSPGKNIRDVFLRESDGAIDIEMVALAKPYYPGLDPVPVVTPAMLYDASKTFVKNESSVAKEIGIILASKWYEDAYKATPDTFGIMFDTKELLGDIPGNRPRECCAIFCESLKKFSLKNSVSIEKLMPRTAVHEVGHLFNLGHKNDGNSFMSQTAFVDYNNVDAFTRFSDEDRRVLRNINGISFLSHVPGSATEFLG